MEECSINGRTIKVMAEGRDPLKMPDVRLRVLGRRYRALCRIQKTPVLLRGGRVITFEQFLADRQTAEIILQEYKGRDILERDRLPYIPIVESLPI